MLNLRQKLEKPFGSWAFQGRPLRGYKFVSENHSRIPNGVAKRDTLTGTAPSICLPEETRDLRRPALYHFYNKSEFTPTEETAGKRVWTESLAVSLMRMLRSRMPVRDALEKPQSTAKKRRVGQDS
jgi:hypothetical protein